MSLVSGIRKMTVNNEIAAVPATQYAGAIGSPVELINQADIIGVVPPKIPMDAL